MPVVYRRLIFFFLLTYAFTWFGWLGNWLAPSDYWLLPMNPLGPLMAAPLVIWMTEGGAALKVWARRLITFRAPLWVYGAAFFIPLAIILTSLTLTSLSGATMLPLPEIAIADFFIAIPIVLISGPFPEEVSFRGYGQVELQKTVSPLAAALMIGVGVVIWHAPLLVIGEMAWPWAITIVLVSIVYAWLYNSGGSVWPMVIVHFVVNYFGGEFLGAVVADPHTQVNYALIYCGLYFMWAAWIVLHHGPLLGRDTRQHITVAAGSVA